MNKRLENFLFNTVGANSKVYVIDNECWFDGEDVAKVLGFENAKEVLDKYVDNENKIEFTSRYGKNSDNKKVLTINESGVYALMYKSKLPEARKIVELINNDILTQIEITGGYIPIEDSDEAIMANAMRIAQRLIEERRNRINKRK